MKKGRADCLKAILKHREVKFDQDDLMLAARCGHISVLEIVLAHTKFEHYALGKAAEYACSCDAAEQLQCIMNHLEVDIENNHGDRQVALAKACFEDDEALLERVLTSAKEDVSSLINTRFEGDTSSLELAVCQRSYVVLKKLLSHTEIDLSLLSRSGKQLLAVAICRDDMESAWMLARHPKGPATLRDRDVENVLNVFKSQDRPVNALIRKVFSKSNLTSEQNIRRFVKQHWDGRLGRRSPVEKMLKSAFIEAEEGSESNS